ncbi:MAG: hypothetical protein K6C41_04715 [Lachnospiraceae bacterium]|nr:hypothetical protein [Lachnospiraceae bacterium]
METIQNSKNDYLLEKRLAELSPSLHGRVESSIVALTGMLEGFRSRFPTFTDHTILHSLDVLDYSNKIMGPYVDSLSAMECYVLIMSCYLHDIGMGVNQKDYDEFSKDLDLSDYFREHPDADEKRIVRDFHNELSGLFVRKYWELFDIPSEEAVFSIIQLSRGHRKTDLFDEKEYPVLETEDGIIRTAYLSAVLRLADEIDIAVDRNPELLFDKSELTLQADIDAFGTHESIRRVDVFRDRIVLIQKPIEPRFSLLIQELKKKVEKTLDYCSKVAKERSDLLITQERVELEG